MKPHKVTFDVIHNGERSAGINSFCDRVVVIVESGDPGGEPGEFEYQIIQALEKWYDGAKINLVEVN